MQGARSFLSRPCRGTHGLLESEEHWVAVQGCARLHLSAVGIPATLHGITQKVYHAKAHKIEFWEWSSVLWDFSSSSPSFISTAAEAAVHWSSPSPPALTSEQKSFLHSIKVLQVEALNTFAYPEASMLFSKIISVVNVGVKQNEVPAVWWRQHFRSDLWNRASLQFCQGSCSLHLPHSNQFR